MGNAQAPCHDDATITKNNFNILEAVVGGLSPKVETCPAGRVRFSGLAQGLDVGAYIELPHFLEQRRARYTQQPRGLVDSTFGTCEHSADVVPLRAAADL